MKRAVVSTYQAASGAGLLAMQELEQQAHGNLTPEPPAFAHVFAHFRGDHIRCRVFVFCQFCADLPVVGWRADFAAGDPLTQEIFGRQYLWNLFSHNSDIYLDSGYNEEVLALHCHSWHF